MSGIWILSEGRWSGGGSAVLRNLQLLAATKDHIMATSPLDADWILVPRNFAMGLPRGKRLVLMPQNAWPWASMDGTAQEMTRQALLRLASEVGRRRADAVIRIGSTIPSAPVGKPTSPIIPNVLDLGFEDAVLAIPTDPVDVADEFLAVGSITTYRNLSTLLSGHRDYLRRGGARRLTILGPAIFPAAYRRLRALVDQAGTEVRVVPGVSREATIDAMRQAYAVAFPSLVEASAVSVLEAAAVNPRLLLSDIPGHRELALGPRSPREARAPRLVPASSVEAWSRALSDSEDWITTEPFAISSADWRRATRYQWIGQLTAFLTALTDH